MNVGNRREKLVEAASPKPTVFDITTMRAEAISPTVLRVGMTDREFISEFNVLTQVPLIRSLPQVERVVIRLRPLAIKVQPVAWKAGW